MRKSPRSRALGGRKARAFQHNPWSWSTKKRTAAANVHHNLDFLQLSPDFRRIGRAVGKSPLGEASNRPSHREKSARDGVEWERPARWIGRNTVSEAGSKRLRPGGTDSTGRAEWPCGGPSRQIGRESDTGIGRDDAPGAKSTVTRNAASERQVGRCRLGKPAQGRPESRPGKLEPDAGGHVGPRSRHGAGKHVGPRSRPKLGRNRAGARKHRLLEGTATLIRRQARPPTHPRPHAYTRAPSATMQMPAGTEKAVAIPHV